MADYNPLDEHGVQTNGTAILTFGPHTGHVGTNIAFCDSVETAAWLVRAAQARAGILQLIGNVDHSGGASNDAIMRGQLLNDIRSLLLGQAAS